MRTFRHPKFTYLKDDTYYFTRAVPHDLRHHYSRPRIVQSLRTRSTVQARQAAKNLSAKLDDYWLGLRLKQADVPGIKLLIAPTTNESNLPTIEEGLEQYLLIKGMDKSESFFSGARRNISYLTDCLGARPLDQYSSADAAKLRDRLLEKGLNPTSLLRIFGGIKAVVNFVILENGFECRNPFSGVYIPTSEARKRCPLPDKEIIMLQNECVMIDDDIRWLLSLISDTGMRLSEAAGLLKEDIHLDEIPYVHVQPHPHRRLKTESSIRKIPLVGGSLWAACRIASQPNVVCFPRYTNAQTCNSNSASAAINKWIKTIANENAVVHGLRHSFRDRLRAVETPIDMIDQLGGWSSKSVGQSYGEGYNLKIMQTWMKKIAL